MQNSAAGSYNDNQSIPNRQPFYRGSQDAANSNFSPNSGPTVVSITRRPKASPYKQPRTRNADIKPAANSNNQPDGIEAQAAAAIDTRHMNNKDVVTGFAGEADYKPVYDKRKANNRQRRKQAALAKLQQRRRLELAGYFAAVDEELEDEAYYENLSRAQKVKTRVLGTAWRAYKFVKGIRRTTWIISSICIPIYTIQLYLWALSLAMIGVGAGFYLSTNILSGAFSPLSWIAKGVASLSSWLGYTEFSAGVRALGSGFEGFANFGFYGLLLVCLLIFVLALVQTMVISAVYFACRTKAFRDGMWLYSWILTGFYIIPILNIIPFIGFWLLLVNVKNASRLIKGVRK